MTHGTHQQGHSGATGRSHAPVASDPEHDIDARSAAIWFVIGASAVFFCLWIMVPIFVRVQEAHKVEQKAYKTEVLPNAELHDVKEAEMQFLNGANPTKKSIDQVLQQLSGK